MYCVLVCHNGLDAAELLLEQNPDVLVVDLRLPGIDGVTLLQMARDSGIRVQTIVLADYLSNHIAWILERLEIASVLRYDSSVHCITARVLELLQDAKYEEPRMQIQRTLALLGFKLNTTGYRITEQAIYCYWENPGQQVTKQLYPLVAVLCSGTASQVEKAIRSSVETAWKNGDRQVWKMYFGNNLDCPSFQNAPNKKTDLFVGGEV